MLDEKTLVKTMFVGLSGVALSLVVWILTTLIEVDKRTAVIATKVESNHAMLTPLWEDFIRRKGDGNLARINAKQVSKPPQKRKWSKGGSPKVNCKRPRGFSERAHCAGKKET